MQQELDPPEIHNNQIDSNVGRKILVRDRTAFVNPSPLEFEMLNRLEDKARLFQQGEVKEKSPTYLVTLDQFHNQTSETSFQNSVERLLDLHNHGRNRVAYLYPYLIEENSKILVKLALIHPPLENGIRDALPFCRSLFESSKPYFDRLLLNRKNRPIHLGEENPGAHLLVKREDKKLAFVPKRLSIENEFKRLVQQAFVKLNLRPLPTDDFFERFSDYLKSNQQVQRVTTQYHVIIDELILDEKGNYANEPEIVQHYRAQVDALQKHLLPWLMTKAEKFKMHTFVSEAEAFQKEFNEPVAGRNQRKEKADALVDLIKQFSTEEIEDNDFKKTWRKIQESFSILESLNNLKDDLIKRRHQKNVENLANRLSTKIRKRSGEVAIRDLTTVNLQEEIKNVNIIDESDIQTYTKILLDLLKKQFGFYIEPVTPQEYSKVHFVDVSYYLAVEAHLARKAIQNEEAFKRLEILNRIKNSLDFEPGLAAKLNESIDTVQRAEFASAATRHSSERSERIKREEFNRKYNMAQGSLVSLFYLMLFTAIASQTTWWLVAGALITLPFLVPLFFKRRQKKNEENSIKAEAMPEERKDSEDSSDATQDTAEKRKNFYRKVTETVAGLLLPVRFETLAHRSFSSADIAENLHVLVEKLPEFARFKKEPEKILKNIDLALLTNFVKIKIPENLSSTHETDFWYIPASDYRTNKEALGEGFRDMLKQQTPGSPKFELFKHLVNCIEMYHHPQYKKFIIQSRTL